MVRRPVVRAAVLGATLLALLVGCAGQRADSSSSTVTPTSATSLATAAASPDGGMGQSDGLTASWRALEPTLSGPAGIAVAPVGGSARWAAGRLPTEAAWSTAKVPVAIAALQAHPDAETRALALRAITASDNEAAERLWASLGSPAQAGAATARVLRAAGDARTRPQTVRTRPPWSSFGQTSWRVDDAATVAAHLPCRPEAAPVLSLMGQVTAGQRWGLGRVDGARFKGGWGPSGGGYLVRQLGVVPVPGGQVGVAVAVRSPGGLAAGSRDLDRIAAWLQQHAAQLPAGHC